MAEQPPMNPPYDYRGEAFKRIETYPSQARKAAQPTPRRESQPEQKIPPAEEAGEVTPVEMAGTRKKEQKDEAAEKVSVVRKLAPCMFEKQTVLRRNIDYILIDG